MRLGWKESRFVPVMTALIGAAWLTLWLWEYSPYGRYLDHGRWTEIGLAASVWTENLSLAHKVSRGLRAGTVWVNCHNVFDANLPFGGYKQSGWGREMGHEVLEMYTEVKTVCVGL